MSSSSKQQKICVIGGNGYIGNRLLFLLGEKKYHITVVDSNEYANQELITINQIFSHCYRGENNSKDLVYIVSKYQDLDDSFFKDFDAIILLAGQGSVSNSKNLNTVLDNNINNFAHLLSTISPTQKFIYASSSSVYGKTTDSANEDSRFADPYNYYDLSKQVIDKLAYLSGKCYYGLRFGTVNGASYNLRNDLMINSMVFNAKKNGELFVTNKDINRPILGIEDLCKGIITILEKGTINNAGVYNMNSFNSSVDDIAKSVCKIMNEKGESVKIKYIDNQGGNQGGNQVVVNFKLQTKAYDFMIESSKFEKAFDFKFSDTIESIINDLLSNWSDVKNFQNRLIDTIDDCKIIDKCRVCKTETNELLDLNNQPLANSYHDTNTVLEHYPLQLDFCPHCFHVQLNAVVQPDKLFKNYLYVSGTSNTLREYFSLFAISALSRLRAFNNANSDFMECDVIKVLDIACNDGSQLDAFEAIATNCNLKILRVGVDPAENIYENFSKDKNHDIYCEYFTQNTVDKLKARYGNFDIIIAQNVFAHIDYPSEFLDLCKQLTKNRQNKDDYNDGIILIQTSQKNMILNGEFDTAYHEHLSFFNTNSMKYLCSLNDLVLNNVTEVSIHGTSYIFEITNKLIETDDKDDVSNTVDVLYNEMVDGLYDIKTYKNYKYNALIYRNRFHNKLLEYKLQDKMVIGYGSTAKSNTLLNFCNINTDDIDWIIDENELKQNLFTPGSDILIRNIESLDEIKLDNTVVVVFAWNFFNEIKDKIVKKIKVTNGERGPIHKKGKLHLLNIHPIEELFIDICY
jgi:nucleoside-diphosphate-sugar epimerase/2-polyprenyl-3-methyl-5-hydroxy-6-metoxy-1,4-benzoquinol methylase